MKIIVDLDGTLTNFDAFVFEHAPSFISKRVGLTPVNLFGYNVDEVFDLANQLVRLGKTRAEADAMALDLLNQFWDRYYLRYCFANPFRKGVRETLNPLYDSGHEIFICTSRNRACDPGWFGRFIRWTTLLQVKINGVKATKLLLFPDDRSKADAVKLLRPDLVLEDKPKLLVQFSKFTHVVCINTSYNCCLDLPPTVYRADGFENGNVLNHLMLLGESMGHRQEKTDEEHYYSNHI